MQDGRLERAERRARGGEPADDLAVLEADEGEAQGIVERRPDDALQLVFRQLTRIAQWSGGSQPSSTAGFQSLPTVFESATQGPSSGCGNLACCSLSWMP